MGFRKIKAKKYSGIFEYFKDRDKEKIVIKIRKLLLIISPIEILTIRLKK